MTWKLKRGVQWHDGKPFTADDVVFNWEFAADPGHRGDHARHLPRHRAVDKLDSHTVRVVFEKPTPFWAEPFCGVARA